jgi:histidinol-phosphate aminotransferase
VEDQIYFEQARDAVVRSREALTRDLQSLGFVVLPSAANFIFVRHPAHTGESLASALRARHILVRHFKLPRISNHLRITIGTDEQCNQLVAACREILK